MKYHVTLSLKYFIYFSVSIHKLNSILRGVGVNHLDFKTDFETVKNDDTHFCTLRCLQETDFKLAGNI